VNKRAKRIVIAIGGTSFRDLGDLKTDYAALRHTVLPEQFRIALDYARDVRERFGATHAISCSGHSLGGGACAYLAATLGMKAVTINPIAAAMPHRVCKHYLTRIDNYVMGQDIAFLTYQKAGRQLLGNVIHLNSPWRDYLATYGKGTSLRFDRLLAKPVGWIIRVQAHRLEAALDTIAQRAGVARPSSPIVGAQKQRRPAEAAASVRSGEPLTPTAPSGICSDGKRLFTCQVAGGR
jgi:hypothetical protein